MKNAFGENLPAAIRFPVWCHPKTPKYHSAMMVRRVSGSPSPIMPKDASLSDSYEPDCVSSPESGMHF